MVSEHQARVVPFSADPEDTSLTLMVECFECPQRPLRWGFSRDTRENLTMLTAEAVKHNAESRYGSSVQTGGTMGSTTDESEKP
jgi:hypothetical protein